MEGPGRSWKVPKGPTEPGTSLLCMDPAGAAARGSKQLSSLPGLFFGQSELILEQKNKGKGKYINSCVFLGKFGKEGRHCDGFCSSSNVSVLHFSKRRL